MYGFKGEVFAAVWSWLLRASISKKKGQPAVFVAGVITIIFRLPPLFFRWLRQLQNAVFSAHVVVAALV